MADSSMSPDYRMIALFRWWLFITFIPIAYDVSSSYESFNLTTFTDAPIWTLSLMLYLVASISMVAGILFRLSSGSSGLILGFFGLCLATAGIATEFFDGLVQVLSDPNLYIATHPVAQLHAASLYIPRMVYYATVTAVLGIRIWRYMRYARAG